MPSFQVDLPPPLLPAVTSFLALALVSCATGRTDPVTENRRTMYEIGEQPQAAQETTSPISTDAEEAPDKAASEDPDTLAAYTRLAIQNNSGLRAAYERWVAAMEEIPQARALPDPQLMWTQFVEEVQTRTGPQEARLSLSQQFPWFGTLRLRGDAAAERAESLWWEVEAQRLTVIRDVKVAYYEYGYLYEAIRIVDENLTLLKSLEPIVQRSIQVGGNQGDLIRLQVEIGKLENEVESLNDFRMPLNARLKAVMNVNDGGVLPWPGLTEDTIESYSQAALRDQFQRLNPTLKARVAQITSAESMTRLARRDGYPDFSVGLNWMPTGDAVTTPEPSGSGDDPWGFTVGLSLPIYRQKYKAGVREALARESAAEHSLRQTRYDLLRELEYRVYEMEDAARQVELYGDTLIPRAQQALEVIEIDYESDNATFLDVIDAQRELLAFERSYWRFIATQQQRLADIEMFCGGTLP